MHSPFPIEEPTWKQALADIVLRIANDRQKSNFSIDDVYNHEQELSNRFPANQHVREKIRQVLQQLRDDGLLLFHGRGQYQVNLGFEDITGDEAPLGIQGFALPTTRTVVRKLRLRCTVLASEMKRRYHHTCQLCRTPVFVSGEEKYAEAHHLKPLGNPHLGPDIAGNILVLCPNHHVMFDRGAVMLISPSFAARHIAPIALPSDTRLYLEKWHEMDKECVDYYNSVIAQVPC